MRPSSRRDYRTINGFSNRFWGWGKEDDDLYQRMLAKNLSLSRETAERGRYECIDHERGYSSVTDNVELLMEQVVRSHDHMADGLNTIVYEVLSVEERDVDGIAYIHIRVDF